MKKLLKKLLKLSPIPLTQNHGYDILTKKIINKLPKNANCIDVGCYKGEILDLMLQSAPEGIHLGIEPIPSQFQFLESKYMNCPNCKILNVAASNETGTSSFNFVTTNPPYSGLRKRSYDKPSEKESIITVKTEKLDDIIPEQLPVHLIKIDVEGAEFQVLEGATKVISTYKPIIIFEHGLGAADHYDTTPTMIFDYFEKIGMKISTLKNYYTHKKSLSKTDFEQQFYQKANYYFVAYSYLT